MLIEEKMRKYVIKTLSVIIFISIFVISGCKGKEVEQSLPDSALTEQQEQTHVSPETSFSEDFSGAQETITNTPPRITSINVIPQTSVVGDQIKAEVKTYDREGDTVTVEYQWSKNGVILSEDTDKLSLSGDFKRGDRIALKAIPYDGKSKGSPVEIVITISNALPEIKPSSETFRFDGDFYSYQVKATDPDGDPLTYFLKSAPAGMTINPSAGLIQWNVPPEFKPDFINF
jgi:hypothetical protein